MKRLLTALVAAALLLIPSPWVYAITPPEENPSAWSIQKNYDFASGTIETADFSSQFAWLNGQKGDELAYYMGGIGPNRQVLGGVLQLTAIKEDITPWAGLTLHYTTGQVTTLPVSGTPRLTVTPGTFIELSMMPAKAQGLVSAAYLLPVNGSWPPEIDIVEILGNMTDWTHGTIHYGNPGQIQTRQKTGVDLSADFHRYGCLWDTDGVSYYLDGELISTTKAHVPPNTPMFLLVGLSVGSGWSGPPPADFTRATMQVDWVRVWRRQ